MAPASTGSSLQQKAAAVVLKPSLHDIRDVRAIALLAKMAALNEVYACSFTDDSHVDMPTSVLCEKLMCLKNRGK